MSWASHLPYFPPAEVGCRHCGKILLNMDFAVHLPELRHHWGEPLLATSICRCVEHNQTVGGHRRSLHLMHNPVHPTEGTMAADLHWADWGSEKQLRFARFAYKRGWAVGLHNTFIHIDRRATIGLPQNVFLYGGWAAPFGADHVTGDQYHA